MDTTMAGADEEDVEGNRLRNKAKNRNYKKSRIKNSSLERGERFCVSSEKVHDHTEHTHWAVNERKIFSLDIFRPHKKKSWNYSSRACMAVFSVFIVEMVDWSWQFMDSTCTTNQRAWIRFNYSFYFRTQQRMLMLLFSLWTCHVLDTHSYVTIAMKAFVTGKIQSLARQQIYITLFFWQNFTQYHRILSTSENHFHTSPREICFIQFNFRWRLYATLFLWFRDVRESVLISARGVKALENLFSFAFPSFAPFSTSRRYIIHTRNGTRERCREKNCFCVWINISKDLTHPTFLFPALTLRRRAPNIKRCELVSEMFKKKLQFTSIRSWVRNFPPRLDSKGLTLHSLFPSSDWSSLIIFALFLHSISERFGERKKNC